jgi:hypothetical protein
MAFDNTIQQDAAGLDAGELLEGHVNNTDAFGTFEDGLKVGRFAKYDTGSADNLDGSATPTIAGVVKRNLTGDLSKTVYDTEDDVAEISNFGYIVVEVVDGNTPAKYGQVYAENAGINAGADYGKATTLATGNVAVTGATFHKEIKTNVWAVKLGQIL